MLKKFLTGFIAGGYQLDREILLKEEFEKLYEKNFKGILLLILKYVNDYHVAEDLAQDCFLRVYSRFRSTDLCLESARNYLYKSAKNAAIDFKRKSVRDFKRENRVLPELVEMNSHFYDQVENVVIDGEVLSTVNDILSEFPEKSRQIFLDRVVYSKNLREVSREQKITLYRVGKIEKELRSYLKTRLKYYYLDGT